MSTTILSYLTALELNNEREWFHDHKAERDQANQEFEDLIRELMFGIGKTDPSILGYEPKELTFKLVRDTRFSHDKSPYNPTFRCHISSKGKLPIPVGYYLSIHPHDKSFLGGGLFTDMFKDATTMIRDYIRDHAQEFIDIISASGFSQNFKVSGSTLKHVPSGYPNDSPVAEYLKYKSWYIESFVPDRFIEAPTEFIKYATEKFLLMKPFNDFLNSALKDFIMPSR